MINNIKVLTGFAAKLKAFSKPIEFDRGLNILFGPNSSGKSTCLKIIGGYCSIDCQRGNRGWTTLQPPAIRNKATFPKRLKNLSPGYCEAEVEWDGTPTLFADSSISDQTSWTHFYDKNDGDGMTSIMDQIGIMYGKPSSGTLRLSNLKKYYDALSKPPTITEIPKKYKGYNSVWMNCYKRQVEYFKSLKPTGLVTLLMDEPDRSLSIENQFLFWTKMVPRLVEKAQVIIATHCPFALLLSANWIDFEEGYYDNSLKTIKELRKLL